MVRLDGCDDPIGELGSRWKRSSVSVEDAETYGVIGGDDIVDTIAVQIACTDVLVVAAVVPARLGRWRRIAGGIHLGPVGQQGSVRSVHRRRRTGPCLVDEDVEHAVAVDVGGRYAAHLHRTELHRPPRAELPPIVIETKVDSERALDPSGHCDLELAVSVEVTNDR